MKQQGFLFLILSLLLLPGCITFSHVHYRKLNKVPAHPEVQAFVASTESHRFSPAADSSFQKDSAFPVSETKKENILPAEKTGPQLQHKPAPLPFVKKGQSIFPKYKKVKAVVKKSARPGWGTAVLLVLLLLLLIGLLVAGIWIFVNGIIFASVWLILLGLVMILLSLVPVLGVFMAMGDRAPSEGKEYK